MHAWEFSKALHLQRQDGWARFVAMQDHYNLLAREEEHEMLPLCADEGVGTIVWSPLARGRLARPWNESTTRSTTDGFASMLYTDADSDRSTVEAVGAAALEAHYTPRHDFQGISDDAGFARIMARIPDFTPAGA